MRWGSIDPLFEKYINWTPYNYVLGEPLGFVDPDGRQLKPILEPIVNPIRYGIGSILKALFPDAVENYNERQAKERENRAFVNELTLKLYNGQPSNSGNIESAELQPADFIGAYFGIKLAFMGTGSALNLSIHAIGNMEKYNVTEKMIINTIKKGEIFTGHSSKGLTYVLRNANNGKHMVVAKNLRTNKIITAYPTRKLVITSAKGIYQRLSDNIVGWSRYF